MIQYPYTHSWHTLTTSSITLADGQRVSMVVPSCLLPVSPGGAQAGNERVFSVVVDMNSPTVARHSAE
ncbi:hypothetical protein A6833_24310 [Salmonella enterica]|uniref:Uncharacterized protein n=2 Tax=Salmonella enterica TaxID=28901 RepID=A0A7Z1PMY3_SALET|nr:hypothetical protein [Salmonella enterica subsp. enterica serovar Redlands]EAA8389874.1 hypothetical protein [Salmonella enterica]EAB9741418.1 hypothetical protein [Salmonella enterica subsp. diarizonae]EAW1193263.1 hypothetical protein [Salmonella enterica subsp. enterica]EBW8697213.1 hypothetical protein [Salmonella enterica subsp. diarizonae serovar 16:z10:e,n,x,z15]ECT9718311.1 hypothetical protein [Salmonella enterica subsp. diarizonae str. CFSAN000553]EGE4753570.1 hypothetical protei